MFCFQECNKNSDCRNGKLCDTLTSTCRKPCEEKKDCNGTKQTCDTSTGFCEQGGYLFIITPIGGSFFVFKNVIKILTAEMVRYVTHQLKHAEYHVKRRKIVMVLDRLVSQAQAFA